MKLNVTHQTKYQYSEPVSLGHNQLRLMPRSFDWQQCEMVNVEILPAPTSRQTWLDPFGNQVTYFTLEEPHLRLDIRMQARVEVQPQNRISTFDSVTWEDAREQLRRARNEEMLAAQPFLYDSPFAPRFPDARQFAESSFRPGISLLTAVRDLTKRIHTGFRYDPHATTVNTTPADLLSLRRGVCQDFAHLQISALRSLGIAARYVSGYLVTRPPPGRPRLIGADATHAWVSVLFPGSGWLDFDPTNDCLPGQDHITLAWGRDYGDIAPIKGLYLGGGLSTMHVAVDVESIDPPTTTN